MEFFDVNIVNNLEAAGVVVTIFGLLGMIVGLIAKNRTSAMHIGVIFGVITLIGLFMQAIPIWQHVEITAVANEPVNETKLEEHYRIIERTGNVYVLEPKEDMDG